MAQTTACKPLAVILTGKTKMLETICDINGLNSHPPLFYTERYLQNEYVKANDLAKHIHLFDHPISYIDYTFFSDLKGSIHKINETVKEKKYDGAIRSEPLQISTKKYIFNKNLELTQLVKNETAYQEVISLFDSLKKPKKLQVVKSFDKVETSQTDITYSDFLEFEQIEETTFNKNKTTSWARPKQTNTRYRFEESGKIYKIHTRNNSDEQSKTTVIYNSSLQLLESRAYSQKNKSELLYEAAFIYSKNGVQSIKYNRYKPSSFRAGNWTEVLTFEYNENGLLDSFKTKLTTKKWMYDKYDNPISIKEFDNKGVCIYEEKHNYKYDRHNNWTFKEGKIMINTVLINESQTSREIEYF